MTMGTEDHEEKKNLLFVNMNVPHDFKPDSLLLGCPRTSLVQQLFVHDTYMIVKTLIDNEDSSEKKYRLESLRDIIHSCHTVVIPDSMFLKDSSIFKTLSFLDNGGTDALRTFFRKGGNVVIMCMEGSFAVTREINDIFWTDWHVRLIEQCEIAPTYLGQDVLGGYLPNPLLKDKAFFIEAPPEEGMYGRKIGSKKDFIKNFKAQDKELKELGIEPDSSMDCFDEAKSWKSHLERYKNRYCIAVHQGNGPSGKVIWYGDRAHTEQMAYVFLKVLNLGGAPATLDLTPLERGGKIVSADLPIQEVTVCRDGGFEDEDEDGRESTSIAHAFCKLLSGW